MIILVRHAQSEGNKDRDIHQFIPDHRVRLTNHGWTQVLFSPTTSRTIANESFLSRLKKQDGSSAHCSSPTTLSSSSPHPTAVLAKPPRVSSAPSPPTTPPPRPSHGTRSLSMRSRDYENRTLATSSHVRPRWRECGRSEPTTATSSTAFPMEKALQMPTIASVASMRACGANSETQTSQVSASWSPMA
jgi:hypothetical protein